MISKHLRPRARVPRSAQPAPGARTLAASLLPLLAFLLASVLAGCAAAPPPAPPAAAAPPETAEKPADPGPAETVYLVVAKSVNVRESASASSATLSRLKKGDRITLQEEKGEWLRVKLSNTQVGWVRRDLVRKDDGCLADRREVLLTPPMLHMSEGAGASGTPGPKGKVVVEADIDEKGNVAAVRVVKNETGSPERAEMARIEVQGVTFRPPVKKCRVTGFTYVYTRTF